MDRKYTHYQKTDFNHSFICQLPTIFKCSNSRCKKNNNILVEKHIISQNCLFCGMPNQPYPPLRKVEPNQPFRKVEQKL